MRAAASLPSTVMYRDSFTPGARYRKTVSPADNSEAQPVPAAAKRLFGRTASQTVTRSRLGCQNALPRAHQCAYVARLRREAHHERTVRSVGTPFALQICSPSVR